MAALPIQDLQITYGDALAPPGFHRLTDGTGVGVDLNAGGTLRTYLWYKPWRGVGDPFITALTRLGAGERGANPDVVVVGRTINRGSGAPDAYLGFTRAPGAPPVVTLAVVEGDPPAAGVPGSPSTTASVPLTPPHHLSYAVGGEENVRAGEAAASAAAAAAPAAASWSLDGVAKGDWLDARLADGRWVAGQVEALSAASIRVSYKMTYITNYAPVARLARNFAALGTHTGRAGAGKRQGIVWDLAPEELEVQAARVGDLLRALRGAAPLPPAAEAAALKDLLPFVTKCLSHQIDNRTLVPAVHAFHLEVVRLVGERVLGGGPLPLPYLHLLLKLFNGDAACTWWFTHFGLATAGRAHPPHASLSTDPGSLFARIPVQSSIYAYTTKRVSHYLGDYVNAFFQAGAFDAWRLRLAASPPPALAEVAAFNDALTPVVTYLVPERSAAFFQDGEAAKGYLSAVTDRLAALTDDEVKAYERYSHVVDGIIAATGAMCATVARRVEVGKFQEVARLHVAMRLLTSGFFTPRLKGLEMLEALVDASDRFTTYNYSTYYYGAAAKPAAKWMRPRWLCDFLVEHGVVGLLLGCGAGDHDGGEAKAGGEGGAGEGEAKGGEGGEGDEDNEAKTKDGDDANAVSTQLLSRAVPILKFLAKHQKLDSRHVLLMWDVIASALASPLSAPAQHALLTSATTALASLTDKLDVEDLQRLWDRINAIPLHQFAAPLIAFTKAVSTAGLARTANARNVKSGHKGAAALDAGDALWFGIPKLWDALQDDSDLPSVDLVAQARDALVALLHTHHARAIVPTYINRCIDNLTAGRSVGQSLQLARRLLEALPEGAYPRNAVNRRDVLKGIDARVGGLAPMLVTDLMTYKVEAVGAAEAATDAPPPPPSPPPDPDFAPSFSDAEMAPLASALDAVAVDVARLPPDVAAAVLVGRQSHLTAIQSRLDFLRFILVLAPKKLTYGNLAAMWACCVDKSLCGEETAAFFEWLAAALPRRPPGGVGLHTVLTDAAAETAYRGLLCRPAASAATAAAFPGTAAAAFACFLAYFRHFNAKAGLLEAGDGPLTVLSPVDCLQGLDALWNMATGGQVAGDAAAALVDVHMNLKTSKAAKFTYAATWEAFVQRAVARLVDAASPATTASTLALLEAFLERLHALPKTASRAKAAPGGAAAHRAAAAPVRPPGSRSVHVTVTYMTAKKPASGVASQTIYAPAGACTVGHLRDLIAERLRVPSRCVRLKDTVHRNTITSDFDCVDVNEGRVAFSTYAYVFDAPQEDTVNHEPGPAAPDYVPPPAAGGGGGAAAATSPDGRPPPGPSGAGWAARRHPKDSAPGGALADGDERGAPLAALAASTDVFTSLLAGGEPGGEAVQRAWHVLQLLPAHPPLTAAVADLSLGGGVGALLDAAALPRCLYNLLAVEDVAAADASGAWQARFVAAGGPAALLASLRSVTPGAVRAGLPLSAAAVGLLAKLLDATLPTMALPDADAGAAASHLLDLLEVVVGAATDGAPRDPAAYVNPHSVPPPADGGTPFVSANATAATWLLAVMRALAVMGPAARGALYTPTPARFGRVVLRGLLDGGHPSETDAMGAGVFRLCTAPEFAVAAGEPAPDPPVPGDVVLPLLLTKLQDGTVYGAVARCGPYFRLMRRLVGGVATSESKAAQAEGGEGEGKAEGGEGKAAQLGGEEGEGKAGAGEAPAAQPDTVFLDDETRGELLAFMDRIRPECKSDNVEAFLAQEVMYEYSIADLDTAKLYIKLARQSPEELAAAAAAAEAEAKAAAEAATPDDARQSLGSVCPSTNAAALCLELVRAIKRHPILELTSEDRDLVLRGLLQVTAALLGKSGVAVSKRAAEVAPDKPPDLSRQSSFDRLVGEEGEALRRESATLVGELFNVGLFHLPSPSELRSAQYAMSGLPPMCKHPKTRAEAVELLVGLARGSRTTCAQLLVMAGAHHAWPPPEVAAVGEAAHAGDGQEGGEAAHADAGKKEEGGDAPPAVDEDMLGLDAVTKRRLLAFVQQSRASHAASANAEDLVLKDVADEFGLPSEDYAKMFVAICPAPPTAATPVAAATSPPPPGDKGGSSPTPAAAAAAAAPTWDLLNGDSGKSATGYVGLRNLGAICYMNSSLQQFFTIPELRSGILGFDYGDDGQATGLGADGGDESSMFFQLQRMFAYLQESTLRFFDPTRFCGAYRMYGEAVDVRVQQDASEFLTNFFQQLEERMSGTPHAELLASVFGATLLNVLDGGEGRRSERTERCSFLSVKVKDLACVQEGLADFVAGESVSYGWETGATDDKGKPVTKQYPTTKSVALASLPSHLLVHLKRFEYDFARDQQVKVNDSYSFPHVLDMFPYTTEGVEAASRAAQAEAEAKAGEGGGGGEAAPGEDAGDARDLDDATTYQLMGVVIHVGTAQAGHYYSIIRDRDAAISGTDTMDGDAHGVWYKFDDTRVTPFHSSEIPEEAFGGVQSFGGAGTASAAATLPKERNAFLLVYDRVDVIKAHAEAAVAVDGTLAAGAAEAAPGEARVALTGALADRIRSHVITRNRRAALSAVVPPALREELWEENRVTTQNTHIISKPYAQLMVDLATLVAAVPCGLLPPGSTVPDLVAGEPAPAALDTDAALGLTAVQACTRYFVVTQARCGHRDASVPQLRAALAPILAVHVPAALWFVEAFVARPSLMSSLILACPNEAVRSAFAHLLSAAVAAVVPVAGDLEPPSAVDRLFDVMLPMLPDAAAAGSAAEFINLLRQVMDVAGVAIRRSFVDRGGLAALAYVCAGDLDNAARVLARRSVVAFTAPLPDPTDADGNALARRRCENVLEIMAPMMRDHLPPSGKRLPEWTGESPLPSTASAALSSAQFLGSMTRLSTTSARSRSMKPILRYLLWENKPASQRFIGALVAEIDAFDGTGLKPSLRSLRVLLSVHDSFEGWRSTTALTAVLQVMKQHCKARNATEVAMEFVLRLAKQFRHVQDFLRSHNELWSWWREYLEHTKATAYRRDYHTTKRRSPAAGGGAGTGSRPNTRSVHNPMHSASQHVPTNASTAGISRVNLNVWLTHLSDGSPLFEECNMTVCSDDDPMDLMNLRVEVPFKEPAGKPDKWYAGKIVYYNEVLKRHEIFYDDRERKMYAMVGKRMRKEGSAPAAGANGRK